MPRDACGDRLPERFLDAGAATLRLTRCFQFSQVVSLQSCRTTPRCYDQHPQPRSGCSAPARPAEYAIRTSRRFGVLKLFELTAIRSMVTYGDEMAVMAD